MAVRAKMRCVMVKGSCDVSGNGMEAVDVKLQAVFSGNDKDANAEWSKWTPQGEVTMQITNPAASFQFKIGAAYFVDFTPAE